MTIEMWCVYFKEEKPSNILAMFPEQAKAWQWLITYAGSAANNYDVKLVKVEVYL